MYKKICFLTPQFKTGGGNRVFIELANILAENYEVEIIYPNNSEEKNSFQINKNINIYKIGVFSNFKIKKIYNLIRCFFWIRKNRNNDLLVISDPIMCTLIQGLPLRNTVRFIQGDDYNIYNDKLLLKNNFILKIYKLLTLISYKRKIKYIFNSKFTYSQFIEYSKRKDILCRIIHPAINRAIFQNFNIRKENEINIVLIGRKHPLKGLDIFLKAMSEIKNIDKINNIYILTHDDLSDFNLENHKIKVIAPKNDNEIAQYMNKSHIFVSASKTEGFCLPLLEAMSCGCATITSNSGGISEFAINEKNSLIFEVNNSLELARKIENLLENIRKRKKIAHEGEITSKYFSWEKSSNSLIDIIGDKLCKR